jgi:hypothetical protein
MARLAVVGLVLWAAGAYLNVLPGPSPDGVLLTVMPVDPRAAVSGEVRCGNNGARKVF